MRHALPQLDDRAAADLLLSIVTLADGWQVFRSVEHLYAGDAAGTPERAARRREVVVASVAAIVESLTTP
ncbi:hypothetical protein B5M43_004045 [Microbacterium sp. MEC084]|uniref:hypothetical protein n=1 Tax=unclassified Microbacterium TaxID=2609290 RepID=UPI000B0FAE61|nr:MULTISPECIES: hypothetical protein [unclassified Microbacterium]MCD1268021.1 hypothetical protein [Microbacterium sp. MEC084]